MVIEDLNDADNTTDADIQTMACAGFTADVRPSRNEVRSYLPVVRNRMTKITT